MISIHNTSSVLFDLLLRTLAGGGRPVCLMGIVGFACFFFNDWNDCHKGKKGLRWLFPAGAVLLGVAVAGLCIGRAAPLSGVPQKIAGIFAPVFAVTEIYTLFFCLAGRPLLHRAWCKTAGRCARGICIVPASWCVVDDWPAAVSVALLWAPPLGSGDLQFTGYFFGGL